MFVPVFVRLGDFDLLMFLVPVNKDRVEFHGFYYFNTVIIITFSFIKVKIVFVIFHCDIVFRTVLGISYDPP